MSEVIASTTTPPVTVVSSDTSSTTVTVKVASTYVVLVVNFGSAWCGVFLSLPRWHSSNLSPKCLLRLMEIMQWILIRLVFRSWASHQWGVNHWGLHNQNPAEYTHGRSSLPGFVPCNGMVNSEFVVGVKSGDSNVVIGYQVDEFICTWMTVLLLDHTFTLDSQAIVNSNQFSTWTWLWGLLFWTKQWYNLRMVLIPSLPTLLKQPELYASFDESDIIPSAVS